MREREITAQPVAPEESVPARDGEPCAQCGSPLAADQRYCLNCGKRRGEPRVEYRQALAPDGAGAASVEPAAAGAAGPLGPGRSPVARADSERPAKGERDYAPLAAVGGIAILGLMLLVGVLIGRGDGGNSASPSPPLVVQSGGESQGNGGSAASGGDEAEGAGGRGGSGGRAKGKNAKGGEKSETAAEAGAVTASKDDLAELESETGEDAAKNALKLPDKIATPGAPPPIDKSKPPGGGEGGGLVIK